jgi:3-hydroxy-9,10-secoandrosta-1,3,5(10)-triene-9,17-dione monooxygenase
MLSHAHNRRPHCPPTAEEEHLLDAALSATSVLADHAHETETLRRLAEPSLQALREAGFFRMATPRALGGYEVSVRTATEVGAALAHGCASSSWIVGIAYGGARYAAQLSAEVRQTIWQDGPDSIICGSVTPHGSGLYADDHAVISGSWPLASGIRHAQWIMLGLKPPQDRSLDRVLALLPMDEVVVKESWYVAGLRGTGSETAVVGEATVPTNRLLSYEAMADGIGHQRYPDEPRVTVPISINLPLVGTALGIAESVLDRVTETLVSGRRRPTALHEHVADAAPHQLNVADAAMLVDTAWLHARRAADELDGLARAGLRPDLTTRARMRLDSSLAVRCAREAVDKLMDTAGAGSVADGSFVQRAWRNLGTASRHASFSSEVTRELYGRVLLGQTVPASPLI